MFNFNSTKIKPISFSQNSRISYRSEHVCHNSMYHWCKNIKISINNFIITRTPVCYTAVL